MVYCRECISPVGKQLLGTKLLFMTNIANMLAQIKNAQAIGAARLGPERVIETGAHAHANQALAIVKGLGGGRSFLYLKQPHIATPRAGIPA